MRSFFNKASWLYVVSLLTKVWLCAFSISGAPNARMFSNAVRQKISDGFLYALEACLVNLELPPKLFICSDVLGDLWSSRKF